jgi:hypothetical protein
MVRQIPLGSVEIQNGLWAYLHSFTVGGVTRSYYKLYSAEGYCFYYVDQPENYDEEGKLKAPTERVYAQFSTCMYPFEEINQHYVSVPIEDGYEIV